MQLPQLPAFIAALARAPRRIGAIAPSGPHLARLITSEIEADAGRILELGPGTGVFTQALLDRGVSADRLTLIEVEDKFVSLLRRRFPDISVLHHDACQLESLDETFSAAVSGLPLRNMSPDTVEAILSGVFTVLDKHAALYQFTYGRASSVPHDIIERLGLEISLIGRVRRNFPPASVFRISRKIG